MALSGSLTTDKYNSDRYYKLSWKATQSITNNKSTIEWTLSAESGATYDNWYAERTLILKIDGTTVYSKTNRVERYDGVIATGKTELSHKTDGSKSFTASIEAAVYGSSVNVTGDKSFTLDTIPRYATSNQSLNSKTETSVKMNWTSDNTIDYIWYSKDNGSNWTGVNVADGKSGTYTIGDLSENTTYKIKTRVRRKDSQLTTDSSMLSVTTYDYPHCTNAPDFLIGDKVTLTFYNPLNRSFDFTVVGNGVEIHTWEDRTGTTYEGVNGDPAYTNLHNSIPNSRSAKYKVIVTYGTSSREKQGGTYSIKEDKCLPTFSNFTYKDGNTTVSNLLGTNQILVEGQSQLVVEISAANKMAAQKGATPKKYVAAFDKLSVDIPYSTSDTSKSIGAVTGNGSKRLTVTAFDSRDLPKAVYKDLTVLPYAKPVINANIKRLNNFEAQTTISVSGTYSLLTTGGSNKNSIAKVVYQYRETGGAWTSEIPLTTTLTSGKFTCNNVVISLDNTKSFEFKIIATDKLGSNNVTVFVDIGQAIFHINTKTKKVYNNNKELALAEDVLTQKTRIDNMSQEVSAQKTQIANIVNVIYPVGSVYVTSTHTNPATILGKGTWTLVDKGFKSYSVFTPSIFTASTNVVLEGGYLSRGANTIRIRLSIVVNAALSDTGMKLGTLNWNAVGITGLHAAFVEQLAFRDGANGGIAYSVNYESGDIQQLDVFDVDSIASGTTFYLDFTFVVDSSRMLDSECDKFYWKRTA